ncbi:MULTISPECIES: hypothetical protein [unclassified Caulobacter]|uniref:hypothetical protein n=1 Tax=unclassified Caulobacter TaxID=2648921 RepID=UPI0011B23B09|nr:MULTISPECIES: hypothetical protein [unclassified Caulobacter]
MTALAVMLLAMLVVQAPVAMVDRALHANGQTHAANAFAGPLAADLADHDHDHDQGHPVVEDHHKGDMADMVSLTEEGDRDPSPSQGSHHHHDGPSLLGLVTSMSVASPWIGSAIPWPGRNTSLDSAEPSPQKRPPKSVLEHVA